MYEIVETEVDSGYSRILHEMLVNEWTDLGAIEPNKLGLAIPNPIVVLQDNQVIGGVSFTSHKEPNGEKIVTWINALYVNIENRKRGIATELIQASKGASQELYALTDIPNLYIKAGWKIVKTGVDGTIVKQ